MPEKIDHLLISNSIFTGTGCKPKPGHVAIAGNRIISCGPDDGRRFAGLSTHIHQLGDRLVCPGFADVHCFFNGYLLGVLGSDCSEATSAEEVLSIASKTGDIAGIVYGHGVAADIEPPSEKGLNRAFGTVPVVLAIQDADACWMNSAAKKRFGFTTSTFWAESCWRLLSTLIKDSTSSVAAFSQYAAMLNARGVTSVKEIGYDDSFFTAELERLECEARLPLRVSIMSQPVGAACNLDYGIRLRDHLADHEFLRFSGFNQMTDGSISQHEAEMKLPYLDRDTRCAKAIDWDRITQDVLTADAQGLRFALHAQGDGAVSHALDIYEKCQRSPDGSLALRHAITDLECADPIDLVRMGHLGVTAEIYPQIQSIADRAGKIEMIEKTIGMDRGTHYWNRRALVDSGVPVSCGTDLPLCIDDIGMGVRCAVAGLFPGDERPFLTQNTMSVAELLQAWTSGGQRNLMREGDLGTLEAGKLADITVIDINLFDIPAAQAEKAKICLTFVNGEPVYETV